MKLIVQIPCYNEEDTLPLVLADIASEIDGVDQIETLVIDDGSSDRTVEIANELGVTHIVSHTQNLGLAAAFKHGLDACLKNDADIIVNIDGDNQYKSGDIPKIIKPILDGKSDMVIGDRQTNNIKHFSFVKKRLQFIGSLVVRMLSYTDVPDAVSGFRALSREAAMRMTILSPYTYTIESILQAKAKGIAISSIPIETNPKTRESRLMSSMRSYIAFSVATIIRVFTMYNPLKVFLAVGIVFFIPGMFIALRFLFDFLMTGGQGHIQSLILSTILILVGFGIFMIGLIADLIRFNRRLLEDILLKIKRLELDRASNKNSD